jgi:hypothetical protein
VATSLDFARIKTAVAAQFERMQRHPLFRVDIEPQALWDLYLTSFPPGSNPILRERTEHDCSCCRQFVRTVGNVVAVIDSEVISLWDIQVPGEPAYETVAAALAQAVKSHPIAAPFYHYGPIAGTDRNFEQIVDRAILWTHFHVNIDQRHVKPKDNITTLISALKSQHDVFLRSLQEITPESIETVLDLMAQGSLYRGEEHQALVRQFKDTKYRFDALPDARSQDLYAWTATADVSGAVSRIRNTVIGTLLVDLSSGVDLESAVRSYESKVAPTNYKRPTALVTPAMVAKAKATLSEFGLLSALDRRFATLQDISVNDILFADRQTRRVLTGDVFDELTQTATSRTAAKDLSRVEEIHIDRFISEIVPRIDSLDVLFENRHQPNLVSLIAPCDPTARPLFKWDNNFSWSYAGELADAIRERVKQAGGNVTGDLCCRLAWYNFDDLDLHIVEPDRCHIFYANKQPIYQHLTSHGRLDVDMNAGHGTTREPVENIFYSDRSQIKEGLYHLYVNQYNRRETTNIGFECEIDYLGQVHRFTCDRPVTGNVTVAKFRYTHKNGLEIVESLPSSQATRTVWDLPTQTFHRVNLLLMSPNYWGNRPIGNRHFMFMLDGCRNDGTARGFFNEFLNETLTPHRKVFEILGSKMKPVNQDAPDQLSGLGFSSTRRDTVVVRVKGSFTRTLKIVF